MPSDTSLVPCHSCHLIFHCSTCPPSHSATQSTFYDDIASSELFIIQHHRTTGTESCRALLEEPRTSYKPLSSMTSWYEYYKELFGMRVDLDQMIEPDFTIKSTPRTKSQGPEFWRFLTTATDDGTIPLTILSALEDVLPDLSTRDTLELHLLGATDFELTAMMCFEELVHWLPSCKALRLVLTGPQVGLPAKFADKIFDPECCPSCVAKGRSRPWSYYPELYHDYAYESDQYAHPDLAVIFHSGFSHEETESWALTIRYLLANNIPTLCTTYNEREKSDDIRILRTLGAQFVNDAGLNPWKSLNPRLDRLEPKRHSTYFWNTYRYIFRGYSS